MQNIVAKIIEPKNGLSKSQQRFSNHDLWKLIYPVVIERFLTTLVGVVDSLMISYAGETAVSGVSLVNQLNNVFVMVFAAVASGGAVVASQYIGANERENGVRSASQLITLIFLFSSVITALMLMYGDVFFNSLFGIVDREVYRNGITYLRIMAFSFPFMAIYSGSIALFRSMRKTEIIMYVSLGMNATNIMGNAIGIFILKSGVAGVAYPSVIAWAGAAVVMFVLLSQNNNLLYLSARELLSLHAMTIWRIVRIAVPTAIQNGLFSFSKVAVSSIVAIFGTVQITAYGVSQTFWGMASLFIVSMSPVFITIIGQCMGAGDKDGADYYIRKLLRITFVGSVIWTTSFCAMSVVLLRCSNLGAETIRLATAICVLHNIPNFVFFPYNAMANGLRAAGDVKCPLYIVLFSTVVCRLVFSYILGLRMQLGAIGVTLAMIGDWIIAAILIELRYRTGRWKNFKVI